MLIIGKTLILRSGGFRISKKSFSDLKNVSSVSNLDFWLQNGEKLTKKPQIQSGISNAALHNFSKIIKNES